MFKKFWASSTSTTFDLHAVSPLTFPLVCSKLCIVRQGVVTILGLEVPL